MTNDLMQLLHAHGINPSQQRLAVAEYVLFTADHPTAEQVWDRVRNAAGVRMLARATVYNTLNLLVKKGLLQQFAFAGGSVLFDPNVTVHHHLVDEETGRIYDLPVAAVEIGSVPGLEDFEVRSCQAVLRGRRRER